MNIKKYMIMALTRRRKFIFIFVLSLSTLCTLQGCGGGFGADSAEAKELGPAIFGPDSLIQ